MATRRLTDAFLLLRNNSIQNRQLLAEQLADDRMALVSGISLDPEAAIGVAKRAPPKWVDGVEEVRGAGFSPSGPCQSWRHRRVRGDSPWEPVRLPPNARPRKSLAFDLLSLHTRGACVCTRVSASA